MAALRDYALAYGRAFQMQDDYLDLLGSADRLGKPVGGDLREGKATYPVLVLILEHDLTEARAILERRAGRPGDVERMVALILEHGAHHLARERIAEEAENALRALEVFSASPALNALRGLAESETLRVG